MYFNEVCFCVFICYLLHPQYLYRAVEIQFAKFAILTFNLKYIVLAFEYY